MSGDWVCNIIAIAITTEEPIANIISFANIDSTLIFTKFSYAVCDRIIQNKRKKWKIRQELLQDNKNEKHSLQLTCIIGTNN